MRCRKGGLLVCLQLSVLFLPSICFLVLPCTMQDSSCSPKPRAEATRDNDFAKIIRGELRASVVFDSESFIVIKDRSPASKLHLQVIPKIPPVPRDVTSLTKEHSFMVESMHNVAVKQLKDHGYDIGESIIGFHIPPFISVPHLHMHVIAPSSSIVFWKRLKYLQGTCWFVDSKKLVESLRRGKSIGCV
ncbi:hypothetical protein GUITHDRAFT_154878 [Guillardia theta CCMP2712]|uniref:HIT domain-containing protein n=1 Tax=Guillardia theta (strain CCMP2712) TaxID=905079 RepID=L1IPN2_GUITC|nr:hypothetical protein GUITHDRAFT_154878 [Guillardia theta CCMP2712]EKX37765.1 hypothetical protein GUITHDRAFT_154878 [Guillardia theta CCMP2712]|mmetsp:Transcript_9655/g.32319  ORF Transcript_9655/g.32319 Transcript_9655/m.32319 type:complete len:189 (-) Transcript_9655:436-1002(-)|eukprot:XP_005824745.1 hypothetical protein GUITHDRAFT_154878 [Guillardia theta CCMP2712]